MGEFDLRALQLCELDLLKEVDRICKSTISRISLLLEPLLER